MRQKKVFHANGNQNKGGVTIFISDNIDFKIKTVTEDKDAIMIKGSIQEHRTILSTYEPNTRAPQYIRQIPPLREKLTVT